jgi:hypothetical protein
MKVRHLLPLLFLLACSPKKPEQGAVNTRTVPETLFFCVAGDMTQAEIPEFAEKSIMPLFEALGKADQRPAGNLQFICPEWIGPEAKNKVVFAIPVEREFPVAPPYYLLKAPAFKCAWIEYKGPMSGIKEAWMKFGDSVANSGEKYTRSWREVYVFWVAPDSEENRTELQAGIE